MRLTITFLLTASLGAVSVAQNAPASQTVVKPNAPQTQVQTGPSSLKSPFAPKVTPKVKGSPASKSAPQSSSNPAPTAATTKPVAGSKPNAQPKPTVAAASAKPAVPAKKGEAKPAAATKAAAPAQPAKTVPVNKAVTQTKNVGEAKTKTPEATPQPAPVATAAVSAAPVQKPMPNPGKRDPFISPIAAAAMRGSSSNCTSGKHCLIVDQIVLKGIVQMKEGNFALVENVARRPYVLREKDALFNGTVEKITGDSVVFHETGSDILGRTTSKEVVKKVSAPAV